MTGLLLAATGILGGCTSDEDPTVAGPTSAAATNGVTNSTPTGTETIPTLPTDGTTTIAGCKFVESDGTDGPVTSSPDWECVDRTVIARVCDVPADSLTPQTDAKAGKDVGSSFTTSDGAVYERGDSLPAEPESPVYHPWVTCGTDDMTWLRVGSMDAFSQPSSAAVAAAWSMPVEEWGTPDEVVRATQDFTASMATQNSIKDLATPEGEAAYAAAFEDAEDYELATCAPIVDEIGGAAGHECILVGTTKELTLTLHLLDGLWKVDDARAEVAGDV
ncbi:hypothetical protein [Cellulomonas sp. PhB150]|uniref:hypothetical protein n=1 Tax=Cellulomonas sp. PhB150 TaxID=2485188 RepID=UPI0013158870|nr:hypothetical protein [Cellulomonas sp. PhB150]